MKRNGFTLVELLAVVAILGLLIVIVGTRGFGAFNKAKETINKVEEDNLLEAARTFLVDVENGLCETDGSVSCNFADYENNEKSVPVSYILEHYMNDTDHCVGKNEYGDDIKLIFQIKVDANGNVTDYIAKKENADDVICSN